MNFKSQELIVKKFQLNKGEDKKKLKIVAISDIHGQYFSTKSLKDQFGDIFIMGGDFTYYGQDTDFQMFFQFLDSLKNFKHKIVIAGNHEIVLDDSLSQRRKLLYYNEYPCKYSKQYLIQQLKKRAIYLQHQHVEVQGLKIFGSAYTSYYCGSAFQIKEPELQLRWNQIPKDLDILITHGPPFGIFDKTAKKVNAGSQSLLTKVNQVKPKVHIFGHIHEGRPQFGQPTFVKINQTKFYNVAQRYSVIEIDQQKQ